MNRQMMIDHGRLASNIGTEKFQPHHGIGTISESPIDQLGAVGVMSVIKRGTGWCSKAKTMFYYT